MTSAITSQFADAYVRDLVWVMAAPGLLANADWLVTDHECQQILQRAMPQLRTLDLQPAPLCNWITARNPQRLGRYFEVLLGYWLGHLMDANWFASNQIVKSGRIVIGEYDLLWRDATGQLNHWEVAVKFYLQVDPDAGLSGFIGPMTRDRLDLKVAQLRDKQLQLSCTPAGAAALPVENEPVIKRALLKGWLFYPAHGQVNMADGVSTQHLAGWWQRWQSTKFGLIPCLRWLVLERLSWLSLLFTPDERNLLVETDLRDSLQAHFANSDVPVLVAGMKQTATGWLEVTRGFVVPLNWNGYGGD